MYTYGDADWGDLLTAYDGVALSYDAIGNLADDGIWDYTWEHGRELASMSNGTTTWTYTYDVNGMRTSRTNSTTTYTYVYNGSNLTQMTVGNDTLYFVYDAAGTPVVVVWNGTPYNYVTTLQGDVQLIMTLDGEIAVSYDYDAWGNIVQTGGTLADTLGVLNPLRYRGYVYDTETQLYYLESRYYNPAWGRFINADGYVSTGQGVLGNNMFTYCENNPVVRVDYLGESFSVILGFNFNLFGWGMIGTINLVSTKKDLGIQYSYYFSDDADISKKNNETVGIDLGAYIGVQYTEKDSMDDLKGYAKSTGGDLFLGLDILTEENGNYLGWQFGGSTLSANMHSLYTYTDTLCSIPTIDWTTPLLDWIFGEK